jgi:quercetin dioxygenase-like cupin family protein
VVPVDESSSAKTVATGPLTLKELVAYQEGAIVSRTLVNESGGTVTIFAFDEGQGLSEHTSPFDALVIVIEGAVDIRVSSKDLHLNEGQMIIMPANKPHELKAVTRLKMMLVMVRSHRLISTVSAP